MTARLVRKIIAAAVSEKAFFSFLYDEVMKSGTLHLDWSSFYSKFTGSLAKLYMSFEQ